MRPLVLGFLVLASGVGAQPLLVTSATPADYAAGLPAETTVSFTFSEPLAETAPVSPVTLVTLPAGGVTVNDELVSEDRRTVTYAVTLPPDERIVFLVLGATGEGDRSLARPFALNLSTQGSAGFFTFSGEATNSGGGPLDGALVALVTGDLDTGAIQFAAIEVLEGESASEPFALGPAPFGFYTIGAVLLPLPDPEAIAYGFYDPDGDGTPDVLVSASGNDVTLAPPPPLTAAEEFATARGVAADEIGDPGLTSVLPSAVDDAGRARSWVYQFESDGVGGGRVNVVQVGAFAFPVPAPTDACCLPEVSVPFVDSDAALAVAEAEGGTAFRAEQAGLGRLVTVTMGIPPLGSGGEASWEVAYLAREAPDGAPVAEERFVVTAVPVASERAPTSGVGLRVLGNPSRGTLRLGVSLGAPEAADVVLLDAQGRTVREVHRSRLGAGETLVEAPVSALAPGLYVVRLTAGGGVRTTPVVVVR